MLEILFALFLLGVITLFGHAMWVLLRWAFRELTALAGGAVERPKAAPICQRCGSRLDYPGSAGRCRLCAGSSLAPAEADPPTSDLALGQLRLRVERYGELGLLTRAAQDRIIGAIQDEEATLAAARLVVPPPASPAHAPGAGFGRFDGLPPLKPQEPEPVARPSRVRTYREFRDLGAVEPSPAPASPEATGDRPHRAFDVLAAFLEEKSIRWGELVGGLLIVGCSLALVISFWSSIAERPLVKYGLLNGVTALLFGLGFHAERRWKLPTTALGLLIIATLLTPLNFLAVASLVRGPATGSAWEVGGEVVAALIFAGLVLRAGRSLVAGAPWALVGGVIVPSAAMLLLGRLIVPGQGHAATLVLAAVPWLAQGAAVAGWLARSRRLVAVGEGLAVELLRLVGLATFAATIALGLVVVHAGPTASLVHSLAPLAPLVGGTILVPGLWLWRRVDARELVGYRTAGTAIAASGTLILLLGVVLGWPTPARVVPIALLDGAVFAAIALGFRVPAAHALAGTCLTLASLVGWFVATGRLGWWNDSPGRLAAALLSGASGTALVPITLGCGVVAGAGMRAGRRLDAQAYALVAGLAGLMSLGLVTWHGFGRAGDPAGVTWVYATFALMAPAGAAWSVRYPLVGGTTGTGAARALGWVGSGLLLTTLVQGLVYGGVPVHPPLPWIAALLTHATATAGAGLLRQRWHDGWPRSGVDDPEFAPIGPRRFPGDETLATILDRSAVAATLGAAGGLIGLAVAVAGVSAVSLAADSCWLALVWLALAGRFGSPAWFGASQGALTWAVGCGVAAVLGGQGWFIRSPHPWLDPRTIQAQGLALGLTCLGWIGARLAVRRRAKALPTLGRLLDPPWPAVDRLARCAVIALLVGLAAYAVVPGVIQELIPRPLAAELPGVARSGRFVPLASAFEVAGIPHAPASGAGSWALWGVTLALLLAGQWERFRRVDWLATLAVATLAAPLVAAQWESSVAVASAWRWSGAAVLLLSSALIWDRRRLGLWAGRLGWRVEAERLEPGRAEVWPRLATGTALGLALVPLLAMSFAVIATALIGPFRNSPLADTAVAAGVLGAVAVAVSLRLQGAGRDGRPWVRPLGLVLGIGPLVVVGVLLLGSPVVGADPGSIFGRVGPVGSVVPPILIIAATLAGFAVRERAAGFAFAAGLTVNLAATVAFLHLGGGSARLSLDVADWIRLAQLNAAVAAATALGWMGWLSAGPRRGDQNRDVTPEPTLLTTTLALGVALNLIVLSGGTVGLFFEPVPLPALPAIAGPLGWLALALAAGAVVVRSRWIGRAVGPAWYGGGLVGGVAFLALGMTLRDSGNWLAYHALLGGQVLAAVALPLAAWRQAGLRLAAVPLAVRRAVGGWSTLALGIVVAFAIRAYWADPQSPWWTVGGLAAMGGLAAGLAVWADRREFLGLAGGLVNLAATLWWCSRPGWADAAAGWLDLTNLNVIALALPVPLWAWVDRRLPRGRRDVAVSFAGAVTWGALAILALVVVASLADDGSTGFGTPRTLVGWLAVAAVAVALGTGCRFGGVPAPVAGLYALGLVAAGWTVAEFHLPPRWLGWTGTMVLAAYSVATSFLWSRRAALREVLDRWGFPRPDTLDPVANLAWLVPANLLLGLGVLGLAVGTILTDPELPLRSASAHAALAQGLAVGLLARGARRSGLQALALGVGVAGATAWGWAWIAPGSSTGWLDRAAVLLAALAGGAAFYGLGLGKLLHRENDWTVAARRVVPALLNLAGGILILILLIEATERAQRHPIAIAPAAIAAVALTLVGAAVAALIAAVVPGRDPLGLSDQGRTGYVYGAEVLLATLGAHVKLTIPWIFSGRFVHYWPLMLMGVAFVGVALSELFRRQGRLVLAEPLERTGALLPVFPLLAALWTTPRPGEDVVYLALVGSLYAILALSRTSLGFGMLAALAGNGAFWSWLSHQDRLSLFLHPQLWVIPPALCVLVGAYLNRNRLTKADLAGIRYAALTAIYLASTADIVLNGVARAPWLPAVLAALSVAGIFAGISLRVRGFLFLGLGFLSLALFSVIWYAAVDLHQTWLWAASGVVAGVLILIIFGLFEKKRQDVLRVVGQLKEWSP